MSVGLFDNKLTAFIGVNPAVVLIWTVSGSIVALLSGL
jgi:hypothetical protein